MGGGVRQGFIRSLLHYTQLREEHYQEYIEAIKKPFWYNCLYGIAWIKVKCCNGFIRLTLELIKVKINL